MQRISERKGMGGPRSHRDLVVWQKAMELAEQVFRVSRRLPREEMFGLRSQLTRAAASVPANIAEGHARTGSKEYAHFLSIARGSLAETETFLLLSIRMDYFELKHTAETLALINELERMLSAMRDRLSNR